MSQTDRLMADAQNLHRKGHVGDALKLYERILKIQPTHGTARLYMAIIQHQKGLVHDALANARRAINDTAKPDVMMYSNYGVMLKNVGQYEEAERAYSMALQLEPANRGVKANLATLYMVQGKLNEAEPMLRDLTTQTEEPAPWLNLARIAFARNDLELVDDCLRHAEDLDSSHADISIIRAAKCVREHDHSGAWAALKKVFVQNPAHSESWHNVQTLDQEVLEIPVLERMLNTLASLKPQSASTLASCVDICRKNLIWGPLPALESQLTAMLQKPFDKPPSNAATFTLLAAKVPQEGHLQSARASWLATTGPNGRVPEAKSFAHIPAKEQIRVGFLSSDLRSHAVGINIVGLMEKLPRGRVTWYAYNNSFDDYKDVRTRFNNAFDRFINVTRLSDAELAERIRQDEIDVLIDLNGITSETRITVMAHRAAPVQATWFGMAGSPGSHGAIDYYFADAVTATPENAVGFDECLIALPRSYQPADHVKPDLSAAGTRAEHGLPENAVVFCSFNQFYKLSPDTFALWARLLKEVPTSVLWVRKPKEDCVAKRFEQLFTEAGIAAERIIQAPAVSSQEMHRARIAHADLFLDSWPYNAHSTAADALSVGVPVLTLPGSTYASRVAAGVLTSSNLPEWIADTPEAYFKKALAYAQQSREAIDAAKAHVLATYWASPMVDTDTFAKYIEQLCIGLYARAAAGLPPASLLLHPDGTLKPLPFGRQADQHAALASKNPKTATNEPRTPTDSTDPDAPLDLKRGSRESRLYNLQTLRQHIMGLTETPLVVDIGATPVDGGVQGFEALADAGLLRILGFEPNKDGFDKLIAANRPNREYVCAALGTGTTATYHMCVSPGMNSLLKPDQSWLSLFPRFSQWGEVTSTESIATTRLDDIPQAARTRYIKLDIQGAELPVLQNAVSCLREVAMLHLKSSPTPCYQGEYSFFEVGAWLQQQGFVLHHLANIDKRAFLPYGNEKNPFAGINHVYQVDAVFIPAPRNFAAMSTERLLALAFLAHSLYHSFDLAVLALHQLDMRDGGKRVALYNSYLEQAKLDA